jgi:hypothetical protein
VVPRVRVQPSDVDRAVGCGDDERLHVFFRQRGRHAHHGGLRDVGVAFEHPFHFRGREVLTPPADHFLPTPDEGVRAVAVVAHEVAGLQPPVDDDGRGLLGHFVVAAHDCGVVQFELADLSRRDRFAVLDDAHVVHMAEGRVLPRRPEAAVGPFAVAPDQRVRRLRHRVAAHELQAEARLDLELALARRRRARVAEAQRVVGVVRARGLPHQDLEHGADRVELRRAVRAGRVEERAGRVTGQQHEARGRGDGTERRVGGRVDVEQRQRRHQPVVAREPHPEREPLTRHDVRQVRLHHELRAAGRAGGRDHHGDVELVEVARAAPVGVVVVQRAGVEHPGRRRVRSPDRGRQVGVGHDRGRLHLLHEAGQLGVGAAPVHRHLGGPHLHQREPRQEIVGRVAGGDEHEVAPADAVRAQGRRAALDARQGLAVREGVLAGEEPRAVGRALDGGSEQSRDGARHGPTVRSACAAGVVD